MLASPRKAVGMSEKGHKIIEELPVFESLLPSGCNDQGLAGMMTSTDDLTDRQLLERFATRRDEESFTQLVQRHGPMVLGVCRQVLRQEQDAEDAFQATFLVLARQAGTIRGGAALPNWLFTVATRLARRMRAAAVRRQAREVALVEPPTSEPPPGEGLGDLGPPLYEEIARLPAKYRIPFVLCYLDGKTNEEAARQLGCPTGTVFSRLAWARERLRTRLTRRGLSLTSGVLAATLLTLGQQARAAVPPPVASTTVRWALRFGAGTSATASDVPARVVKLAEWGLRSLSRHGLRTVIALLVGVGLLAVLGGLFLRPRPDAAAIQKRLQGTWVVASMNMHGVQVPPPQWQLAFKDNEMTYLGTVGTFRIDVTKDPMQLDWTVPAGVTPLIFKLHGDELTLCSLLAPGGPVDKDPPRPQDFSPRPGKLITVLRRQQP
jgi:RNA polymerase sigma factor (sigma-70 family)